VLLTLRDLLDGEELFSNYHCISRRDGIS